MQSESDAELAAVARTVGRPRRWLFNTLRRQFRKPKAPTWLAPTDEINRIFSEHDRIVQDGAVTWAVAIHANRICWMPGSDEYTSGAQVVLSRTGDASLDRLLGVARALFALKGTDPSDAQELRFARMLTKETERALDWQVPSSIAGGNQLHTTIVMLQRSHIPGGFLTFNHFPVLCEKASGLAVMVPKDFWPESFRQRWQQAADTRCVELERLDPTCEAPVRMSRGAADQLRWVAAQEGLSAVHLHVGDDRAPDWPHGVSPLDIRDGEPDPAVNHVSTQHGIIVSVRKKDTAALQGLEVRYREDGTGIGFYFDESRLRHKHGEAAAR
jgi:Fe-S cluster assembly iron-binding protein IscA